MTKIKICGLFRWQDIEYVNQAMPDYIGFVFAESRRRVTAAEAARLRARLDKAITPIGVFVNAPSGEIVDIVGKGIIGAVQLHGSEEEPYIRALRAQVPLPIIKAVRIQSPGDIREWQDSCADFLLLDSGKGGSGTRFDWQLIRPGQKPFFLAGGIDTENIEGALTHLPFCIDVSSGAESAGVKDKNKILRLVAKVHGYTRQ